MNIQLAATAVACVIFVGAALVLAAFGLGRLVDAPRHQNTRVQGLYAQKDGVILCIFAALFLMLAAYASISLANEVMMDPTRYVALVSVATPIVTTLVLLILVLAHISIRRRIEIAKDLEWSHRA